MILVKILLGIILLPLALVIGSILGRIAIGALVIFIGTAIAILKTRS